MVRIQRFHSRHINSGNVLSWYFYLSVPLLIFFLVSCAQTQLRDWEGVTISGRVVQDNNRPVPGAYVYAYREGGTSTLGPADAMSEPTGEKGLYILTLPQGTYTVIARRRQSGSISGPMKQGDLYGKLSRPFPTGSRNRQGIDIKVKCFRQGLEGDPRRTLTTDTRITGTVVDPGGIALSGVNVFAYRGSFRQDPPDYVALATDSEGRFEISLPGDGEYTIGARTGQGGMPGRSDSIGFRGDRDQPRRIREGEIIEGIIIVMKPYEEVP